MKIMQMMTFGLFLGLLMTVSATNVWADGGHEHGDHWHRSYAQNFDRGSEGYLIADNRDRGERRNAERRNVERRNVDRRNFQQRNVERRNAERRNVERRNFQQRNVERRDFRDRGAQTFRRNGDDRGRRPGYVLDKRYNHDRYYPPRGYFVNTLPRDYMTFHHRGRRYFYRQGIWYRSSGLGFTVVMPPFGLIVPLLPPFYTTIWVAGVPYYYADGIYYVWQPSSQGYVVTAPPEQSNVATQPPGPDQFYVYPMKGQSKEQQATDRYECHRWAVGQTGFDPSQPVGNLSDSQLNQKTGDYRRAIEACLEARGYSVK